MASEKGDLLLGKIALKAGLITREQLFDSLLAQERNPSKSLGALMVSRGYLKNEDVDKLLDLQKKAFETAGGDPVSRRSGLFGRLLVDRGLATEYQVNECLRLQGRLAELGIRPMPLLGEILVQRGYLNKDALETALQLQNLQLYVCPECGAPIDIDETHPQENYICKRCSAEVPLLFAKMAAAVKGALEETSRELDIDLPDEVRVSALEPANNFGRYVLIREIGRGGAGIVYRAWQKDLNKLVALKLLPHESDTAAGVKTPFGDMEDVKRFYTETRAAADLSHPNIVPILDFGNVDNHFFYTMNFIEGVTLDGIVRDGIDEKSFQTTFVTHLDLLKDEPSGPPIKIEKGKGMPHRLAARVMHDVALGVDFAHQRGIYHRDIKPANIMIDRSGKPWIMDFGLAKVSHMGDPAYVKGVIMGTPYYMPPEQAVGDMEQVDNFSDIYSLGAVLYEMVSGHAPYAGRGPDDVLALLPKEPPSPLRAYVPDVPADLEAIIEKSMQRDKKLRYPSARAFADDLRKFLEGKPLAEEPIGAAKKSVWAKLKGLFRT